MLRSWEGWKEPAAWGNRKSALIRWLAEPPTGKGQIEAILTGGAWKQSLNKDSEVPEDGIMREGYSKRLKPRRGAGSERLLEGKACRVSSVFLGLQVQPP